MADTLARPGVHQPSLSTTADRCDNLSTFLKSTFRPVGTPAYLGSMIVEDMHKGGPSTALTKLAAALEHYLDAVCTGLYEALGDGELLTELRTLELIRRRQPVADHHLIEQLEHRQLGRRLNAHGTATMLQAVLRLSPYEAKGRLDAARQLGPQRSSTGERLPPLLPALAEGQLSGTVSTEHARVAMKAIELLPESIDEQARTDVEQQLTAAAAALRPRELGLLGQRLRIQVDPGAILMSDAEHQRHRSVAVIARHDGSYLVHGRLTPACGAQLLAWLSPRAAPQPIAYGTPDLRNAGQRMHDALEQLAGLAIRRKELHDSGAPAQVIITMTAEQLDERQGWAENQLRTTDVRAGGIEAGRRVDCESAGPSSQRCGSGRRTGFSDREQAPDDRADRS
jgi:hypothetical protein